MRVICLHSKVWVSGPQACEVPVQNKHAMSDRWKHTAQVALDTDGLIQALNITSFKSGQGLSRTCHIAPKCSFFSSSTFGFLFESYRILFYFILGLARTRITKIFIGLGKLDDLDMVICYIGQHNRAT